MSRQYTRMAVTFKSECIGRWTKYALAPRISVRNHAVKGPWVAEITGLDPKYKFSRKFLKPLGDFSHANSVKTRGVFFYWHLFPGRVYDILAHKTWKKDDRFYCRVEGGKIIRLTEEEITEWLKRKDSE